MGIYKNDKILKVVAVNSKNKNRLELNYSIFDIDVVDRWAALIDKNNELKHSLRYNYRRILNEQDILEKFEKFRENILYINDHYDRELTDIRDIDYLRNNQHILNDLHEEYEIYGDRLEELISTKYFDNPLKSKFFNRLWPGMQHDKVTHEAFLLLNEQIHNFEAIFRSDGNSKKFLCTCLYDFMPAGLHENLKPEDYMLFTAESQWGYAYLGYNTLGKHWSSSSHDNDIDVVKRKAVRPQQRFAAETYLNFNLNSGNYATRIGLYQWWLKNNFSEIYDPDMKLSEFCLGFIPVGRLVSYRLNDGSTTNIEEDIDKFSWNEKVWSTCDSIQSVEIVKR